MNGNTVTLDSHGRSKGYFTFFRHLVEKNHYLVAKFLLLIMYHIHQKIKLIHGKRYISKIDLMRALKWKS